MKIIAAPALAAALLLSACATPLTARRCALASAGLDDAARIAGLLIDYGIEQAKARKLAEAVAAGRMLLAAACAEAPDAPGIPAAP